MSHSKFYRFLGLLVTICVKLRVLTQELMGCSDNKSWISKVDSIKSVYNEYFTCVVLLSILFLYSLGFTWF